MVTCIDREGTGKGFDVELTRRIAEAVPVPVIAAGGLTGGDLNYYFDAGAVGVQLATRFIASSDGDAHPTFKQLHLEQTAADVAIITSCV